MAIKYWNVHYLVFYCCVTVALGYDDIQALSDKVSSLQADLLEKTMPAYIHRQVEAALSRILGDQSTNDRDKSLQQNQQRMKRHIQMMEHRVKVLEDQRDRQIDAIRKFEERYQSRISQLEELQEQLNVTQHQGNSTDYNLSSLRDMVSVINTSVVDITKTLGPEVNYLLKQLNVTTQQVSSLQDMVSVINTSVVDINKTLGPEVNYLLKQLNITTQQVSSLRDMVSVINTSVVDINKTLGPEVNFLMKQLNITTNQVSKTEETLSNLWNAVFAMNESVIAMRTTFDQETVLIRQNLTGVTQAHLEDTDSLRNEFTKSCTLIAEHFDNRTNEMKRSINSTNHRLIKVEEQKSSLFNNLTSFRNRVERKFTEMATACACVEEDMNRLLVISDYSATDQYPDQIDLHSNTLSNYSYLRTSNVSCVTYDPTSRRIIFSRNDQRGIYSSRVDVTGVETLKTNVASWGMTVDDDRRLIFMTTFYPDSTISRMTTRGEDFHVILGEYRVFIVIGISIDSRREVIYFCNWNHLNSVDYDGGNFRSLKTMKRECNSVVFDPVSYSLFYNDGNKVELKSLSTGNTTEVAKVSYLIVSMVLHKKTLYISSFANDIDVVHLGNKSQSKIRTLSYGNYLVLIP